MGAVDLARDEVLLVASRGLEPQHGLWLWWQNAGQWSGRQVDSVNQLSSLTGHPHLPVVYGAGGADQEGTLHAWRIDLEGDARLSETSSIGAEPCDVEVDPSGRLLIATNYTSGTLTLQRLDASGAFVGPASLIKLTGSGPELARQEAAHPHQAFFNGEALIVIDLGADLVREFALNLDGAGDVVRETQATPVPPGTGPRHGVVLPDGRLAISGELGETLITGQPGGGISGWAKVRSTRLEGPAKTRWERNYPGDIKRSQDGQFVYLANRSHDTLATFDVSGDAPRLVSEIDTGVHWPQHILVLHNHVLVAGWDSSRVVALRMHDGIPQEAVPLFDCAGAGWLHLHKLR